MTESWKRLLDIAIDLIEQANRPFPVIDVWTLGGGTAMMIQIDHRESRDIDIFFDDPQILAYLDPGKRNFELHVPPSGYHGDGARFLRLAFESLGEIDFIACPALTAHPSISSVIDGRRVEVETLEEIIAKKVFFRGAQIKPRDIFDIAAASISDRASIVDALSRHRPEAARAIAAIERNSREYIDLVIADLQIKPAFAGLRTSAADLALEVLRDAVRRA